MIQIWTIPLKTWCEFVFRAQTRDCITFERHAVSHSCTQQVHRVACLCIAGCYLTLFAKDRWLKTDLFPAWGEVNQSISIHDRSFKRRRESFIWSAWGYDESLDSYTDEGWGCSLEMHHTAQSHVSGPLLCKVFLIYPARLHWPCCQDVVRGGGYIFTNLNSIQLAEQGDKKARCCSHTVG